MKLNPERYECGKDSTELTQQVMEKLKERHIVDSYQGVDLIRSKTKWEDFCVIVQCPGGQKAHPWQFEGKVLVEGD
jgi:hypothetical protein